MDTSRYNFSEEEWPQVLDILANHVCKCGYKRKDHEDGDICPSWLLGMKNLIAIPHDGHFEYSETLND